MENINADPYSISDVWRNYIRWSCMDCTGRFKGDVIKKVSVYFGNEIDAYFFILQFTRPARS